MFNAYRQIIAMAGISTGMVFCQAVFGLFCNQFCCGFIFGLLMVLIVMCTVTGIRDINIREKKEGKNQ